jgi:calcineurin-like phosphoesterase family protein
VNSLLKAIGFSFLFVFLLGNVSQSQMNETAQQAAKGFVYNDLNHNMVKDANESGIPGVLVSNGLSIVETNALGQYQIPVEDNQIIFVIKPTNWKTPFTKNGLPLFYYLHYPYGSPDNLDFPGIAPTHKLPASVDFALYAEDEPESYRIVVFGDPQVRDLKEVDYLARDIIPSLIGTDAKFGVSLGDLAFNDLRVLEPLNEVVGAIGIPWYNILGNHDENYKAPDDVHASDTFKRIYGPTDYSFNYGPVHYIVLDDVTKEQGNHYYGSIGTQRLKFIEADLARVDDDALVVIMCHIPFIEMRDRQELFNVLQDRENLLVLSAHAHIQKHLFYDWESGWKGAKPLHELVHAASCGRWWGGELDEVGIPETTMKDGCPNGWSFIELDGNQYRIDYRAARRPADYQMDIIAPSVVEASELLNTEIMVNVFAGSDKSTAEMKLGKKGEWLKLQKHPKKLHSWTGEFTGKYPVGTHVLSARSTDMFGVVHSAHHVMQIQ